jgi:predicted membrane protein
VSQSQRAIHGHVPCDNFDYSMALFYGLRMTSPVTPQWSWIRVFDFWGVNGGVVHGRGFESLTFGVNGGVVHGLGFESLTFRGE